MIAERAAGERAQELPELNVVPQMLAAGWGGVGRVAQVDPYCAFSLLDIPSLEMALPPPFESRALQDDDETHFSAESIAEPAPLAPSGLVSWLNGRCGRLYARARAPQSLAEMHGGPPAELLVWMKSVVRAGWDEAAVPAAAGQGA